MLVRRFIALVVMLALLFGAGFDASAQANDQASDAARAVTGGAQTLEDILARQRGEAVDYDFRRNATGNPGGGGPISGQLGTLGGTSDAEMFRALRFNTADIVSSVSGPATTVVMQDGGMWWLEIRRGPLPKYGGYLMLGMIAVILAFFLFRGKIRIEGEKTGETVLRFRLLERIAHWAIAIPFILLAITGLVMLFGRVAFIPLFGHEAFSVVAKGGKFIHNYIAWIFMAGLILSFFLWAWKNLPDRHDIPWLLKGGGLFTKGSHPSAGKFNAGEKIIFWTVIILGVIISATGVSMLFPFELQMFAPIYEAMNALGVSQFLGLGELNTALTPQEEMQLTQLWHAIIAFIFMSVIIAHIYLGSVGMEGALDSMVKGTVDVQWAKEHHDLWYDEVSGRSVPEHEKKATV